MAQLRALSPAGIGKIHVTPQQYGAKGDGTTDDSAAFVAALAYLKSTAVNIAVNYGEGSRKRSSFRLGSIISEPRLSISAIL